MQKRIVKKLVLAAALSMVSLNALAIDPGFYMGLMMGPAQNGAGRQTVQVLPIANPPAPVPPANSTVPTKPNTAQASPRSTQFGSRLYFGYKFNQIAGFELGFTYFSGVNFNVVQNTSLAKSGVPGVPVQVPLEAAAGTTARLRDIDFVGKVDYAYNNTIGFYGKAGVAGVYTTVPGALQPTNAGWQAAPTKANPYGTKLVTTGHNSYRSKITPTFSVGVTYDINQSWQTDASWTRILVGGAVKNVNFFALGLSYHFVDVYCGQFLCAD